MSSSRNNKSHVAPFVGPPWYVAAIVLAVALTAQTTIVHAIAIHNVVPSLVLVAVVWYAIRVDARRAALFGLIAGLCEDALGAQTGASWTIATTLTAILVSLLSRGFFADSMLLVLLLTAFATFVRAVLFWLVMALGGYPSGLGTMHAHEAFAAAVLNVVVMAVVLLVTRRFNTGKA